MAEYTPHVTSGAKPADRHTIAVYPGSFDPITNGHLDIVERAARMFDEVVVAVGQHPTKPGYFPVARRCEFIDRACANSNLDNVRADNFEGLVVDYCRSVGARVLVRGLRAVGDFESEFQMGLANRDLAPDIDTIFLIPPPNQMFVSSSLIREIAGHGGDCSRYVTPEVEQALREKIANGAS